VATGAPRKARSPKARRPIVLPAEARSLVEIVTTSEQEDEGIPLFSIDGVVYTMPSIISAAIALEMLDRLRTESEQQLIGWMLEEVLGTETYNVLKSCDAMTPEQLRAIMDHVSDHVLGSLGKVAGN